MPTTPVPSPAGAPPAGAMPEFSTTAAPRLTSAKSASGRRESATSALPDLNGIVAHVEAVNFQSQKDVWTYDIRLANGHPLIIDEEFLIHKW